MMKLLQKLLPTGE